MKHLVIVGFGSLVYKKYLRCIQNAMHDGFISSYSVIELESKRKSMEERVRDITPKPDKVYFVPDMGKNNVWSNKNDFKLIFEHIQEKHEKIKVYIATEVKAHEGYLRYCVKEGIDSLVEKPVLAPMQGDHFKPRLIESVMQEIIRETKKRRAQHSVMTSGRYHELYNRRFIKEIGEKIQCFNSPITSLHIRYAGGVWNLHDEYDSREDHPYKYGYGMIMHGGYHYVDILAQIIDLNKNVFPDETLTLSFSSNVAFPKDQNDRISSVFSKKFEDYCPQWSGSKGKNYGETDVTSTFSLKRKTGAVITIGTLSLEQTTPSVRKSKQLCDSIYNKNGRVSKVEIEVSFSTLHSVQVQCTDVPAGEDLDPDRIPSIARIIKRSNAFLLPQEEFYSEQTFTDVFHSDSNKRLLQSWLRGEEDKSLLKDHMLTMRIVQHLIMSVQKQNIPAVFEI